MDQIDLDETVCPSIDLPFEKKAIYALLDPRNMIPRYVGATSFPRRRYWEHVNSSFAGSKDKDEWIRSLLKTGLMPVMRILEIVRGPWGYQEERWIRKLDKHRMLFNLHQTRKVEYVQRITESRIVKIHRATRNTVKRHEKRCR